MGIWSASLPPPMARVNCHAHAVGERLIGQLGRNQQRRHVARVKAGQLEAHQPAAALQSRQLAVGRDGRRRVGDHIPRHVQPDGERLPVELRVERFQSRLDGRLAAVLDLVHFHKHGHHHL
jgi:hypothetical protein